MIKQKPALETEYLASFPQLNPNPVLEVDLFGNIVFHNPAADTILRKLTPQNEDPQLFLPDDLDKIIEELKRDATMKFYREITIEKSVFEENISLAAEFQTIRIYANDITGRRRTEGALKERESQQKAILNGIPDLVWLKDRKGRFIMANQPFAKSCGISSEELVGKTSFDVWPGNLAEKYEADDQEVMETGTIKIIEEPLADKENRIQWIEAIKTPIFDRKGRVTGLAGIARDITGRRRDEERMKGIITGTINAISKLGEIRDPYTAGHENRVAALAAAIAEEMGLTKEQEEGIRISGLLHDVGKIAVPAEILSKPGRLSDYEYSIIKLHPRIGHQILKEIEFPWEVAKAALQHHERMNGSGYPEGLSGDAIILEAKILAVADVVEAMSSHRPYRAALGIEHALREISENKGALYDPQVAEACLKIFAAGFIF